jgi:hypothetical protein
MRIRIRFLRTAMLLLPPEHALWRAAKHSHDAACRRAFGQALRRLMRKVA